MNTCGLLLLEFVESARSVSLSRAGIEIPACQRWPLPDGRCGRQRGAQLQTTELTTGLYLYSIDCSLTAIHFRSYTHYAEDALSQDGSKTHFGAPDKFFMCTAL
jgi:hypothetical protein